MSVKSSTILLRLLLVLALWGCAPQISTGGETDIAGNSAGKVAQHSPPTASSSPPEVTPFTLDDLFEQGDGGCGMSLLQSGAAPGQGFLFFNGLGDKAALMKINGEWVRLQRTATSGEEFYGQATSQTFVSEDGLLTVETEVTLGAEGEIESVEFSDAVLRVTSEEQTVEIAVEGDAGC